MLVGFMHRSKKPPLIAKVTSVMSAYYGFDIVYLRPWDVDMKNGSIKGKIYKNNKWISVKRPLPKLIDVTSQSFKEDTRNIMNYLRNNTVLTFDKQNTPNKERLQNELSKDSNFAHLVIPTRIVESFETLELFLNEYSSIIMKPLNGKQGIGLYSLRKQNDSFLLAYDTVEKELNHKELFEFFKKFLTNETYILQKLIESKTKNGDPFDCRIFVQKDGSGKWVTGKFLIRIGTGQKVVSNTSQGGGISKAKPFLKNNFGDQWKMIYKKLNEIAVTLPYKIEEIKKTPTMDLGLDVGIEENGDLFLFESNNGASIRWLISESAMFRLEYYKYLCSSHPDLMSINTKKNKKRNIKAFNRKIKKIQNENQLLTSEKDHYKKELSRIKNSRSWQLTKPVRKISSLIKKIKEKIC